MKTLRFTLLLAALLALAGTATTAHAEERVSLQGILIAASNEEGQTDRRLAPFEGNLRRVLRFRSYRYIGEGSTTLGVPGEGALGLGRGHRLEISTDESRGNQVRVNVQWREGGSTVLNTGLSLAPGAHTVLGGARGDNDEVYAVILIRR